MASHTPVPLSTGEKLYFFFVSLPRASAAYFYDYARRAVAGWSSLNGRTLKRNLVNSMGSVLAALSVRELQFLNTKTTGDAVRSYAKANQLAHASVPLTDEDTGGFAPATLHLIELPGQPPPSSASVDRAGRADRPVLLYFHGGSYVSPLSSAGPARILADRMGARRLAVLEYGLAPACRYPTQLAQAAAALRYLAEPGPGPGAGAGYHSIVVCGDSAGANLALGLLAHLQAPHPRIRPLPSLAGSTGNLLGVLAISPRTRYGPDTRASYDTNAGKDMLHRATTVLTAGEWRPALGDIWAEPDLADRAFWQGMRADRVLLAAGGDEIFRDEIVHTAQMMGVGGDEDGDANNREDTGPHKPVVQLVVCPGETHVQGVVDLALGIEGGIMTEALLKWLDQVGED